MFLANLSKPINDGTIPIGTFTWHTGSAAPNGWLVPDGQPILRLAYPGLWDFAEWEIANGGNSVYGIQEFYGIGDGSTSFTMKNVLNEFIRATKAGRAIGSWEGDAIRPMQGEFNGVAGAADKAYSWGFDPSASGIFAAEDIQPGLYNGYGGGSTAYQPSSGVATRITLDVSRAMPTDSNLHPQNLALLPIVKY